MQINDKKTNKFVCEILFENSIKSGQVRLREVIYEKCGCYQEFSKRIIYFS